MVRFDRREVGSSRRSDFQKGAQMDGFTIPGFDEDGFEPIDIDGEVRTDNEPEIEVAGETW